jgi:cell division protein FtsQ
MTARGHPRWRLVRAGPDAVPARVRRLLARHPQGPGPARRVWALPGLVALLVGVAAWVLWGTALFSVREVRVAGTEILSPAQVAQAAAVPARTPLLRVSTGEISARVGELAPVAGVRVRRAWPDALVIEVVERTAVAAVPASGGFTLIDATGIGYRTVPEVPAELPVVVVAAPGPEDPATRAALTVLAALTPQLAGGLDTLTVSGPTGIRLALDSGRTVVWGDHTASAEKAQVATALLSRDGQVIDVSVPTVVSVR